MAERLSAEELALYKQTLSEADYNLTEAYALAIKRLLILQAEKEHLGTELADAVAQCVQLEKVEEDLTKRLKTQEEWVERWMSTAAQNEAELLLAKAELERSRGSIPLETVIERVRTTLAAHIGETLNQYIAGIIEVEIIQNIAAPKGEQTNG